MRSSIVAAALVVGSFAIPAQHQPRAVVTDWDVVYETQIVTVTAAGPAPAPTQAPAPAPQYGSHRPHGTQHKQPSPAPKPQPAPAPVQQPAPAPQPKPAPAPQPQPAPAPVYSPQPAPKPAPSSGEPSGYNDRCVWHHNQHRANHSAADLTWSNSLASTARKIAETCVYAHSMDVDGGNYGQNIAAGIEGDKVGEVITGLFYNGEFSYFDSLFGLADPDMALFHKWGHLTQVVWKGTTEVGCYTADCSGQGLANVGPNTPAQFTVCNYGPPGNYEGQYGKNVGKPLGRAALLGYNP